MVYNGQPTLARSWNLSDDLGQIEYIFSDKTGTLTQVRYFIKHLIAVLIHFSPTQNSMVFRKCSIGGKIYNGDNESTEEQEIAEKPAERIKTETVDSGIPLKEFRSSASSNTGVAGGQKSDENSSDLVEQKEVPIASSSTARPPKVIHHFRDAELGRDLMSAVHEDLDSAGAAHARQLNGFFSVLALCHTVLTSVDPETGKMEYKAQSPDEAALVQAAADVGFVFRGREKEILYLQTPFQNVDRTPSGEKGFDSPRTFHGPGELAAAANEGLLERYELLNILEFTSARKRMSVVLRKLDSDDGRLFLLSKGADNVIFERLKEGVNEDLKKVTEDHLDEFAGQGLRTLTLAYKVIGGTCFKYSNPSRIVAKLFLFV